VTQGILGETGDVGLCLTEHPLRSASGLGVFACFTENPLRSASGLGVFASLTENPLARRAGVGSGDPTRPCRAAGAARA
jgi:hypothetical protein